MTNYRSCAGLSSPATNSRSLFEALDLAADDASTDGAISSHFLLKRSLRPLQRSASERVKQATKGKGDASTLEPIAEESNEATGGEMATVKSGKKKTGKYSTIRRHRSDASTSFMGKFKKLKINEEKKDENEGEEEMQL